MKCEEIRVELEALQKGELTPGILEVVKRHLKGCPDCAREFQKIREKVALLVQHRTHSEAPAYMEATIRQHFQQRYRPKLQLKIALAVLLVLAIIGTTQATTGFITNWRADKGIEQAILQGVGQPLNLKQTVDGLTYNLHSLIVDANRTVVLFTIAGAPEEADWVSIKNIRFNAKLKQASASYWFDNGVVRGQLETSDRSLGDKFEVEFSGINFIRSHKITFPIDLQNMSSRTETLDKGAGSITLRSTIRNGELSITANPSLAEPYAQDVRIFMEKDGEHYRPIYSMLNSTTWPVDSIDGDYTVSVHYSETLTNQTSEPVTFCLQVDPKKIDQNTVIITLNRTISLAPDLDLEIGRIVSTPSQSTIEYSYISADDIASLDVTLLQNGNEVWTEENYLWKDNKKVNRIAFDPTVPLDRLQLVVNGYYLDRQDRAQYNLTSSSQGTMIDFYGMSMLVEEIERKESGMIRFCLRAIDSKALIKSAALVVSGKKVQPTIFATSEPISSGNYHRFDMTFPATEENNWTLELSHWQEYRSIDTTIDIP